MKTIDLPPYAPTLIESTRAIGYTLESAIADLVDNSIAAGATEIDITYFPSEDPQIGIIDNGSGMNGEELTKAMQYGSRNPQEHRSETDLGRFGLGLKTASLSQCRRLTVISKQEDSIEAREWNIDHVISQGSWSLIHLEGEEINKLSDIANLINKKHGTYVIWRKLDRMLSGKKDAAALLTRRMDQVREHLSLVFHRYLAGESGIQKIIIRMNNERILPTDPFMIGKSQKIMDDESFFINGERILITPYLLPHPSKLKNHEIEKLGGKEGLRKNQGFYIYRNKRLLVWGTWFRLLRLKEEYKLTRIRVDIPNSLDDLWSLDIKKSTAYPPDLIRTNLRNIIEKMAESSKRTYTYRGKRETDKKTVHVWEKLRLRDGSNQYQINKNYPIITAFLNKHPEAEKDLTVLLREIENSLPVNAIYTDLVDDKKIKNEESQKYKDVLEQFKKCLEMCSPNNRNALIQTLLQSDPFNKFKSQLMKEFRMEK